MPQSCFGGVSVCLVDWGVKGDKPRRLQLWSRASSGLPCVLFVLCAGSDTTLVVDFFWSPIRGACLSTAKPGLETVLAAPATYRERRWSALGRYTQKMRSCQQPWTSCLFLAKMSWPKAPGSNPLPLVLDILASLKRLFCERRTRRRPTGHWAPPRRWPKS